MADPTLREALERLRLPLRVNERNAWQILDADGREVASWNSTATTAGVVAALNALSALDAIPSLASEHAALRAFVERVAEKDPIGIVWYERDWSDVTPGAGPIKGCIYCGEEERGHDFATRPELHKPDCLRFEARRLIAPAPESKPVLSLHCQNGNHQVCPGCGCDCGCGREPERKDPPCESDTRESSSASIASRRSSRR